MCQTSRRPVPILLIFGTYHEFDFQIPCAKYKHSMICRQTVRSHHTFETSLILKVIFKNILNSLFINLEKCLKKSFYSELATKPFFDAQL